MLLAQLVENVRGDNLAELLAEEVHCLPVNPLGAIGLGAPLQDGNKRVQREAFQNDVLATLKREQQRCLIQNFMIAHIHYNNKCNVFQKQVQMLKAEKKIQSRERCE